MNDPTRTTEVEINLDALNEDVRVRLRECLNPIAFEGGPEGHALSQALKVGTSGTRTIPFTCPQPEQRVSIGRKLSELQQRYPELNHLVGSFEYAFRECDRKRRPAG